MKLFPPLIAAAALVTASAAQAQDRGWYARGDLGGSVGGTFETGQNLDLENAVFAGAGVGYSLGAGLRAEGEVVYSQNDIDSGGDAEVATLGAFTNVVYDFQGWRGVRPFLGAGLGLAQVKLDDSSLDADETGFAYQAKAGLSYQVNDRLIAEMAYRYLRVNDLEFSGRGVADLEAELDTQAVTVGLRYKLGH